MTPGIEARPIRLWWLLYNPGTYFVALGLLAGLFELAYALDGASATATVVRTSGPSHHADYTCVFEDGDGHKHQTTLRGALPGVGKTFTIRYLRHLPATCNRAGTPTGILVGGAVCIFFGLAWFCQTIWRRQPGL
jgi:hypothetical protein